MRPVSPPFRFLRLATHPAALLALGLNILAPLSAAAQDTSRIARVTVYPGSATVARVAKVAAGARSLTLACLPASLDVQSLQINADPAVRVGEFNVLTENRDVAAGCASPLDGRIRALEDQIAGVKAEASALQLVDGYLRSVAQTGAGPEAAASANTTARAATPTPAQITATAEVLRKSGQDSAARAHQLQRKQEALELALKPLVAERDRVASQRARVVSVTINLATEREAELRLSYQVRGPGWQPSYRATLDANKSTVLIERQALVAQNSGEDWGNVQLTLSTGQPGRATQGQLPRPWWLNVAPPPQGSPAPAMAMAPAPAPTVASLSRSRNAGNCSAATVPPTRNAVCPDAGALASRRASSSGATGRVVSKSVLGVRRNSTWANSGSGWPPGCSVMRATGRSSQSFSAVGSSPCGHSCTWLATPCWASAITSSSRNAPWPMRIWRPSGSVWGSTRSRSVRRVITPCSRRSTSQGCRLCGLGAVMA